MVTVRFGSRFSGGIADDQSGGINLQTVRHEEGRVIHCLKKHTSAVSVLQLGHDEQSFLSGGWDRQVHVRLLHFPFLCIILTFLRNGISTLDSLHVPTPITLVRYRLSNSVPIPLSQYIQLHHLRNHLLSLSSTSVDEVPWAAIIRLKVYLETTVEVLMVTK